jgi:hypothetical protein
LAVGRAAAVSPDASPTGETGPHRSEGEVYATRAVTAFLRDNPDTPLNDVFSHFFPPSTHPFTREELRLAVIEGLYYGRLAWDNERRLSVHNGGTS